MRPAGPNRAQEFLRLAGAARALRLYPHARGNYGAAWRGEKLRLEGTGAHAIGRFFRLPGESAPAARVSRVSMCFSGKMNCHYSLFALPIAITPAGGVGLIA